MLLQKRVVSLAAALLFAGACWLVPAGSNAQTISLGLVKGDLDLPIGITHAGDGSNRLFINLQRGKIVIWNGSTILATGFLDISGLTSCCGERGLLGVAFHPQYRTNGLFFVSYTDRAGNSVIARYRVSASDPNRADAASAATILTVAQPFSNHNGGQIRFGPDGYLYISMGDGGDAGDPGNRSQNLNELLGKMLRIDVNGSLPYAIPAGNPFRTTSGARPEIWAYGLRNAWAFSFDRQTGDLYLGDVGQNAWEEIDFQPAARGGENHGWRKMEGKHCFNPPSGCNDATLALPILEYDHGLGCSVTGGYVYRGARFAGLVGTYLYGDFCSGRIWGAKRSGTTWINNQLLDTSLNIVAWGEDESGEIYLAHHGAESSANGAIYRVSSTTATAGEIIIDNAAVGVADAARSFTGTWCVSGAASGAYGGNSLYSCGATADSYRWTPIIPANAAYDVYLRWTHFSTRSTSALVSVSHSGGMTTRTFNQQTGGGAWVLHGRYNFLAGAAGYVQTGDANGQTNADAVRWVPASGAAVATLNVGKSGSGSGRVTSTPAGIDCGSDCTQDFALNSVVNVTATPAPGSLFVEWGGPCAGNGACSITMNDSKFLAATFRANDLVVDNLGVGAGDAARIFTGTWCKSVAANPSGADALYSCGSGAETYRWRPAVPSTGAYDVYVWWTHHPNRGASVPVKVVHAGGTTSKSYNQKSGGGQWVLHGRYTFNAGATGYVEVADSGGQACADAVRLVPAL